MIVSRRSNSTEVDFWMREVTKNSQNRGKAFMRLSISFARFVGFRLDEAEKGKIQILLDFFLVQHIYHHKEHVDSQP